MLASDENVNQKMTRMIWSHMHYQLRHIFYGWQTSVLSNSVYVHAHSVLLQSGYDWHLVLNIADIFPQVLCTFANLYQMVLSLVCHPLEFPPPSLHKCLSRIRIHYFHSVFCTSSIILLFHSLLACPVVVYPEFSLLAFWKKSHIYACVTTVYP